MGGLIYFNTLLIYGPSQWNSVVILSFLGPRDSPPVMALVPYRHAFVLLWAAPPARSDF